VLGRTRKVLPDGGTIVTIKVLSDEDVFLLSMFDPEEKAIPKVGDKINMPVSVRVYVNKAGLPHYSLQVADSGRGGELF